MLPTHQPFLTAMTEEATHSQLGVREWRSPGRRPRHPKAPVQILGPAGQAFPASKPHVCPDTDPPGQPHRGPGSPECQDALFTLGGRTICVLGWGKIGELRSKLMSSFFRKET